MQRSRWCRILVVVPFAAALVACGGDDDDGGSDAAASTAPPTTAGLGSPCTLLTVDEAAAATGKPMSEGVEVEINGETACEWESTLPPSEGLQSPITLRLQLAERTTVYVDSIEALAADPARGVTVDGLGEMAVLNCGTNETCDEIFVVAGETIVEIDLANYAWPADFATDQLDEVVTAAARSVVSRLP